VPELIHCAYLRAPAATVWERVVRFADYPTWTTSVSISGEARVGAPIDYAIHYRRRNGPEKTLALSGKVTALEPGVGAEWEVGARGLFLLVFRNSICGSQGGCSFVQEVEISGLLAPLVRPSFSWILNATLEAQARQLTRSFAGDHPKFPPAAGG
jgi:hypothetical protein